MSEIKEFNLLSRQDQTRKLIKENKKRCVQQVKTFNLNFQQLILMSSLNELFVLDGNQSLSAIDILQGHQEEIIAFDISQVQRIIASISARHLVIHCLIDSEPAQNYLRDYVLTKISNGDKLDRQDYMHLIKERKSASTGTKMSFEPLQDFAVYTGMLKWIQTYKVELSSDLPTTTLAMSQMGDFLVIAGYQNLAVWSQDAQCDTYMQQILYTKDEKPNQFAQVKEQLENLTHEIVQVQICGSGRMIVSLESVQRTLKIWHQDFAMIKPDKEPEIKMRRQQFNPLEVYELPKPNLRGFQGENSKFAIDRFQILHKEFNSLWIVPTVIVTVQEGIYEAAIWVEQLTEQSLTFSCVKVISTKLYNLNSPIELKNVFDAQFLQVTQYIPKQQVEKVEKWHSSPLFEAQRDKELYFKKIYQPKNEINGIVPSKFKPRPQLSQSTNVILLDWMLILSGDRIEIYKCSGLRNFPQRVPSVDLAFQLQIQKPMQHLFQPAFIQNAYCKSFNDKLNLLCTNKNGQLIKLWCDLKDCNPELKLESSNMLFNRNSRIRNMLSHPQLPVVALIYQADDETQANQIQFFLHKEHTHPLHGRPEMQYLGNYLSSKEILSAKWIPDTMQMLIFSSDKYAKVSVITHKKIFKLGGLIDDIEKLQEELTKLSNTLSPNGLLYETEPQIFEEITSVKLDLQSVVDIFVVNHTHEGNKQMITYAAITLSGKQQLQKISWEVDGYTAVNTQQQIIASTEVFQEGFNLTQIIATNENFIFHNTYVLVVTSKSIDQQILVGQRRAPEKKPLCKMMLIEYSQQRIQEKFQIEGVAEELLERPIQAKFGQKLLGIVLNQGDFHTEAKHLYIYDLEGNSYKGFIDLSSIVYGQTKNVITDFVFLEGKNRGAIAAFVDGNVYLIGERERTWGLEKKIDGIFNFSRSSINSFQCYPVQNEYNNCYIALVNGEHIIPFNDGEILAHGNTDDETKEDKIKIGNFREQSFHKLFVQSQRSMPLFHPSLLEALYIKGYTNLVTKLLVMLYEVLKKHIENSLVVTDYIDMDLQALIVELKNQSEIYILAQGGGSLQAEKDTKKKKAFSVFDDFDENSDSEEQKKDKGEEIVKRDYAKEFKEQSDEFIELLQQKAMITLGLQKNETLDLISFVFRFRNIFEKDFYADSLSSMLLRKIFAESEKVDALLMEHAKKIIEYHHEEQDGTKHVEQAKEVGAFSMEEFMAQKMGKTNQSSGELALCKDWTSEMVAQALHSENQDVILEAISERFNFDQNLTWSLMRRLSIPLWIKNVPKLRQLLELVVKNEYRLANGEDGKPKAESSALWYILLGKLAILQKLYKVEHGQEKFAEFFGKNFQDQKIRTIAGKNAMALVPKKKLHLACGFFLLANDLHGAIQIALDRTKDPNLAVLMCKIHDPQNETKEIDQVLTNDFIKRGETLNDPYLINIGYWLKKDFVKAVNMLAPEKEDNCLAYLFKNTQLEFNLCPEMRRPPEEEDVSKAPKGANFGKFDKEEEFILYPLISQKSYIILDLVKKLQKAPDVKRMLNKDWTLDKKKGQKSIFDDFLGDGSESSEEQQEKEIITVKDAQVLSLAVEKTMQQRFTILGLLLIEENASIRRQIESEQKLKLAKTILLDLIIGFVTQKNSRQQSESVQAVLKLLSETLDVSQVSVFDFILKTCKDLGLIQLEVEMLSESQRSEILQNEDFSDLERILSESQRLSGFILKCSRFGGFSLDSSDIDIASNERMFKLLNQISKLIDCLMLQSCQLPKPQKLQPYKSESVKKTFFDDESDGEGTVQDTSPDVKRQKQTQASLVKNNGQIKEQKPLNELNLVKSKSLNDSDLSERLRLQKTIQLRFHSLLLILISMFHISLICNKHHLVKQIVVHIQMLLGVSGNYGHYFADGSISVEKIEQVKELFQFQTVKTLMTLIKNTLERNIKWGVFALKQVKEQASLGDFLTEIQRRKASRDIDSSKDPIHYQFMRIWLRSVCVIQLQKLFQEKRLKDLQFDNSPLKKDRIDASYASMKLQKVVPKNFEFNNNKVDLITIKKAIFSYEQDFDLLQLIDSLEVLKNSLEDITTHLFEYRLTLKEQFCFVNDLENFFKNRYLISNGQIIQGKYFFPNEIKFKDFGLNMDLQTYSILLKEQHLSLIRTKPGGDSAGDYNLDSLNPYQNMGGNMQEPRSGSPSKTNKMKLGGQSTAQDAASGLKKSNLQENDRTLGNGTETYVNLKLSSGIEIFKQRGELISDFCFDQCKGDLMAFAMQARGMREISVQNTLIYRNRTAQGFDFIDEELFTWSDCLHRYDQIQQVHNKLKPKTDSIKAALLGLFTQPSSFGTQKIEKKRQILLLDQELNPPVSFGGDESRNYLMSYSNLEITHEDYSNAIESHPKLPLYVTGNAKGLLCLWNFGQLTDKSLNQWILDSEVQPAQANPKKSTVRKIGFSEGGDKIAALNMEGTFYMMNFDLFEYSKQSNVFNTNNFARNKEFRANDFQFIDSDSVVACCSLKDKSLQIIDTILPPKHSVVLTIKAGGGGNFLTVNQNKQKIYCFNSKPGFINEYDIRMMKDTVNSLSLSKEEITAVTIDPFNDALVVGFNDGVVKIYDEATLYPVQSVQKRIQEPSQPVFNARETINAFTNVENKKKPVTQLKIHPENGGLFASSAGGIIKLLRTHV